jgi:hypothetical protein
MKLQDSAIQSSDSPRRPRGRRFVLFVALTFLALPSRAHASFLHGETLDTVAGVIAWFAFIIVPPAWLWAYSKPVFHKMAYGTDVDHSHEQTGGEKSATSELEQLRARVAELEAQIKGGRA